MTKSALKFQFVVVKMQKIDWIRHVVNVDSSRLLRVVQGGHINKLLFKRLRDILTYYGNCSVTGISHYIAYKNNL